MKYKLYCEIPVNIIGKNFDWQEYTFETDVTIIPERKGRINGKSEDCYPGEPMEVEWGDFKCKETGRMYSSEEYELLVNWGRSIFGYELNYSLADEISSVYSEWSEYNEPDYDDSRDDYDYDKDLDALDI